MLQNCHSSNNVEHLMDSYNRCNSTLASCEDVELHLNTLNYAAMRINELENKLMEARNDFQTTLSKRASQLQLISNRLGSCVHRARPYYDACDKRAAILNQIKYAVELYDQSSSDLSVYEKKFDEMQSAVSPNHFENLDFMNQLIEKINTTKKEVLDAKSRHETLLVSLKDLENKMSRMKKKNRRSINNAQPYFHARMQFDHSLKECKERVETCVQNVSLCKTLYSGSMAELESLSMSLHSASQSNSTSTSKQQSLDSSSNEVSVPGAGADPATLTSSLGQSRGQGVGAESCDLPGEAAAKATRHGQPQNCCAPPVGDPFTQLSSSRHSISVCFNGQATDGGRFSSWTAPLCPRSSPPGLADSLLLPPSDLTYSHEPHLSTSSTPSHRSQSVSTTTTTSSSLEDTASPASCRVGKRITRSCPSSPTFQPLGSAKWSQPGSFVTQLIRRRQPAELPDLGHKCNSQGLLLTTDW